MASNAHSCTLHETIYVSFKHNKNMHTYIFSMVARQTKHTKHEQILELLVTVTQNGASCNDTHFQYKQVYFRHISKWYAILHHYKAQSITPVSVKHMQWTLVTGCVVGRFLMHCHFCEIRIIYFLCLFMNSVYIVCLLYSCMCDNCSVISNWLWWPRVADYVATKQGACILPFLEKHFRDVALRLMVNN